MLLFLVRINEMSVIKQKVEQSKQSQDEAHKATVVDTFTALSST